jgi:hypothetical protein
MLCQFFFSGFVWIWRRRKKISPYSILYIYNSTIHSLIFFLELIVSFKYISCAKRHEGDIKKSKSPIQIFFSCCYIRIGAAHRYWGFYAYASSPMCFVSLSTEVEYFLAYCR